MKKEEIERMEYLENQCILTDSEIFELDNLEKKYAKSNREQIGEYRISK